MNWRPFISMLSFILLALIVGGLAWISDSQVVKWSAPALSLALVSIGLGLNSFMLSRHTDRTMNTILSQIELLRREKSRSPLAEMIVGIIDVADSLSSRNKRQSE